MPDVFENWDASLEALSQAVREISEDALDGASEEGRARTVWAVLSAAAQYVVNFRSQDPHHPQFTPLLNDVFNSNPNPDFMYRLARVRGDLHYVIEGTRGTSRFVEIQQMAGLDGSMSGAGRLLGRFSLDEIELDAEGRLRIDLGPGAPPAGPRNWIGLHPEVTTLFVREGSYDWRNETDATLAIACTVPAAPTPQVTPATLALALR